MRLRTILPAILCLTSLGLAALHPACAQTTPEPTTAQKNLPTEQLTVVTADGKPHPFTVEIAQTPAQQETGLMFRTAIAANAGMLFPWPTPQISEMWMKNTLIPLDMVFIGPHGTIRAISENTIPQSLRIISSQVPVAATLELQAGITAQLNINVGDKVLAPQFTHQP
jgi:uncharacterized membrane protein (UPF0127 family)